MASRSVVVIDDSSTVLKVVQLVLSRAGYAVYTALDGPEGLRLAREVHPRVILVDFVMPQMNGYQVCRALSESPDLADVPVVLMSAKGDEVGERFVKVMGIVGYLSKPFSPEALTEAISNALDAGSAQQESQATDERPSPPLRPSDFIAEGTPVDAAPPSSRAAQAGASSPSTLRAPLPPGVADGDDVGEQGGTKRRWLATPALGVPSDAMLADRHGSKPIVAPPRAASLAALRDSIVASVTRGDLASDATAAVVRERLGDDALGLILDAISDGSRGHQRGQGSHASPVPPGSSEADIAPTATLLEGDIAGVPVAGVLGLLDQQRQTGVLELRRGAQCVTVIFRDGKVDYAGADGLGEDLRLGNFLVEREAVSRQDLDLFFNSRGTSQRLFGEQLVRLNHITPEELRAALARQTSERIFEVLRWRQGRFSFGRTADPGLAARQSNLQLSVEEMLLEGFRRIDEWHLIEREVDDFEAVFMRNEEAVASIGPDQLTRDERAVLDLVNARNTVREVVRQSRMGTFVVAQLLSRLRAIRLIRRRLPPMVV